MYGMSLNDSKDFGLADTNDYSMPSAGGGAGGMSGAGLFASANPYTMAAYVGLSLLQQKAADERARRQREAEIALNKSSNESNILNNMQNYYGRALLR